MERRVRLGDVIDDYCTRCRMIMNHGIVGMVGDDVAKVRCNTCQAEHAFKHGRIPKRRRGETDRLFAEVLRGIRGEPDAGEESTGAAEPAAEAGEEEPGKKPRVASRGKVTRHARAAASRTAARHRSGKHEAADLAEPPIEQDEERNEPGDADLTGGAGSEMSADAGDGDEADPIAPEAGNTPAPDERDEEGPSHGVRRKLFTIRRHSGGKPPVAGVTTDGSAERAARGQGMQQQGQGRFGGRGGHGGGGRHGHGGHGGHGQGGGRQDQQGRWPRRHRRRG